MSFIKIIGMGKAVPSIRVRNQDLEKTVETSDAWIRSRTGIKARHFCGKGESALSLAAAAAENALRSSAVIPAQVGLVITACVNPDCFVPSMACLVEEKLGICHGAAAFDINAACSGFIYSLQIAQALMENGSACDQAHPYALLIGTEQLSRMLNFKDRSTCVLFGDGAAAALVRLDDEAVFFSHTAARGDAGKLFAQTIGPNDMNAHYPAARTDPAASWLKMDGPGVFRFAVTALEEEIRLLEEKSGVGAGDIDYIVCHQANARIIEHVRKRRGLPKEKFFMNLQEYGNTSGASIPLALCEMMEKGMLQSGRRIFCIGFGAGLTWAGAYLTF